MGHKSVAVTDRGVAAEQRFKCRPLYYKWPEVGGCNKEVAALQSDHYTEVSLYYYFVIIGFALG